MATYSTQIRKDEDLKKVILDNISKVSSRLRREHYTRDVTPTDKAYITLMYVSALRELVDMYFAIKNVLMEGMSDGEQQQ